MKKRTLKSRISLLLVVALVVTSFPSYVFGYANTEDATKPVVATGETLVDSIEAESGIKYDPNYKGEVQIVDELSSKRGEFEKHFVRSDGTAIAVSYPEAVHYQVNSTWEDIDSRLVVKDKEKELYGPAASDLQVLLPGSATADILVPATKSGDKGSVIKLSSNYLTKVTDGEYSISWNILGNSKDYTSDFLSKATSKTLDEELVPVSTLAQTPQLDLTALSKDEQKTTLPNLVSTAIYKNIVKNVDLSVTVTPSKLKENLILSSPKGFESISYLINAGNLIGKINEDNSVIFSNDKDEIVFTIPTPLMLDSNTIPQESMDIGLALEKTSEGYILTLTPDTKWLNDPARVYPVVLDPTIKTTQSVSNVKDTYIHSGDTAGEHYLSSYIRIGDTDIAICRGYVDFVTRPSIDTNLNDIVGGDFIGYLVSGTSTYHEMKIYQTGTAWTNSTITWANKPTTNTYLSSANGVSSGGYYKYTFNVDSSAKNWYSTGVNNGYVLRYTDETINDYNWFYSSDHPTISTSYYPCLAIEYAPHTLNFTISPSTSSSAYTTDSTPTLTWSTNDLHCAGIQYAIGSGAYTTISTSKTGSYTVPTGKVVSGANAIKLRVIDASGNTTIESTVNYYFDNTIPATLTVTPASSTTWKKGDVTLTATGTDAHSGINNSSYLFNGVASTLTPSNTYKVTTEGMNSISICVKDKVGNQKSISGHLVYIDNSSPVVGSVTAAKSDGVNIPLPAVTTVTNPTIKLVDITDTYSGLNAAATKYAIRAVGSTATLNYQLLPSPTVSTLAGKTTITSTLSLAGYSNGAYNIYFKTVDNVVNEKETVITYTLDTVAPVLGTVTVSPATTPTTPTKTTNPTISVSGITDLNFLKTMYSIDDGITFKDMVLNGPEGKSGSFTLPLNSITAEGVHKIKVKAVDKAGNFAISTAIDYHMDDPIVLTSAEYLGNVSLINYYGKNLIHWNPPTTIPSQVFYKVYRGTTSDFTMDSSTLLASDLKTSYYTDMSIGGSGTYYYKVKVIKKNLFGEEVTSDVVSGTMSGTQKPASEFGAGIGQQFFMDYFTFGTPSGNGYVEKRYGNLGYTQQDFTLSNMEFDYGLTRTYNSQSANTGMLGKGWSDSYHQELYKDNDGKFYFRTGDGTNYTFIQVAGAAYKCEQTKDYVLTVNTDTINGVKYSISTKDNTKYDFNTYGQIVRTSKPKGFEVINAVEVIYEVELKYEYDSYGRLANVVSLNSLGEAENTIGMTYSQTSPYALSKIVLPDLTERSFNVSSGGQLDSVTASRGGFTGGGTTESVVYNYGYDASTGLLNLIKDGEQNAYTVEYTNGKATKVAYPNSEYYQIEYSTDGNGNTVNTVTKKLGGSVFYSEQSVLDNTTGKILTTTDAAGLSTLYEYSFANNALLVTQKTAHRFYETLDLGTGIVGFASQPTIETTTITYNGDENVTSSEDAVSTGGGTHTDSTTFVYGDSNNPNLPTQEVTSVNGQEEEKSEYTYDVVGRVTDEVNDRTPETNIGTIGVTNTNTTYNYQIVEDSENPGEFIPVEAANVIVDEEANPVGYTTVEIDGEGNQTMTGTGTYSTTGDPAFVDTSNQTASKYDGMGRVIEEVDQAGKATVYCYDYLGRGISTSVTLDSQTKTTTSSYNKNGSLTSTTDGMGTTTAYSFDSINRETAKTITNGSLSGGSATTSYGYEYNMSFPAKLDTASVDIAYKETTTDNGKTRIKWTDGKGHLVKEEKDGVTRYFKYDQSGNQMLELTPNSSGDRATMSLYDEKGNQFATIQNPTIATSGGVTYTATSSSILTRTLYYDNGKVKADIDGKGVITHYTYDTMDRVTAIQEDAVLDGSGNLQSGGIQTTISYPDQFTTVCTDGEGTLSTKVVNAAGLTIMTRTGTQTTNIETVFDYDEQGRLIKETYKDGSFKSYEYNAKGLLMVTTTSKMVNSSPEEQIRVVYNYDSNDQISDETDYMLNSSNVMTAYHYAFYEYDALGRMTGAIALNQEAIPTPAGKDSHRTSYAYNAAGQVIEITYPQNTSDEVKGLKYNYDSNGRISTVVAKVGTTDNTLRTYTYDSFGVVSAIEDNSNFAGATANIVQRSYTYDNFGRVTSMQYVQGTTTLESFALTYDLNSNITSEVDGSETKSYSYDDLGRLTTVQTPTGTTTYTYDNAGNRTSKENATTRNDYDYNGLNQLTSMVEEEKDANEDFQPVASTAYVYDAKGNLTQDSETRAGVQTVVDNTFTVDSMLAGTTIQADSQTTLAQANTYNGNGQRITRDENGALTNYFYQGSNVLYTTDSADAKTSQNFLNTNGSAIATARYAPTDISYYLYNKDIRNSTASILDETAGLATKYSYDEFGVTTVDGSYTFANEICYTGGIYDWLAGQYYLNSRYYDPQLGRFLSEDTYRGEANEPNSWHLYAYCANNPINYVDPSGHTMLDIAEIWYSVIRSGMSTECELYVSWKSSCKLAGTSFKYLVVENIISGVNYKKILPKTGHIYRWYWFSPIAAWGSKKISDLYVPLSLGKVRMKVGSPMVKRNSDGVWYPLPNIYDEVTIR